ncbi:hypothetical protein QQP08_015347 [Theobroma cacao]|nr:hypothetical protein QQP08_015347 [Theobroma cacao]
MIESIQILNLLLKWILLLASQERMQNFHPNAPPGERMYLNSCKENPTRADTDKCYPLKSTEPLSYGFCQA